MKSKGFTLIELLAVIVILAVIALIATPLIMGTITKAKRNAMKDTAYGIIKAGEQYAGEKLLLAENNYAGETITLPNQDKIKYKGGEGTSGELKITKDGDLAIQIHNNQFCAIKNFGEDEVTVTNYDDETCKLNDTPESVSFAEDSWDTIVSAVQAGSTENYHVGDTKEVDMGTFGTHTLRIANTSTPAECSTAGFSQTACGFVLEFADIITTRKMNSTNTNVGGWPASDMYTYVQNDIYNALPSELKNGIIDTYVVSGHGKNDPANFTSTDKLYLLSTMEVWGSNPGGYDTATAETRQLDYYKAQGVTTSNKGGAIKQYNGSNSSWWLHAAISNDSSSFYFVYTSGDWAGTNAFFTYGVAPAFRIG